MYGRSFINDYTLQAFVDNELDREEAQRVEAYIRNTPEARKRYEALLSQKIILARWWKSRFPG